MKKLLKKFLNYTHEGYWFAFGVIGYLLYKEFFIVRPFAWYDFIIVAPFFGLIVGVAVFRWLHDEVNK